MGAVTKTEVDEVSNNSQLRKVVTASMAGTVVEWYEFFIYGTAATLVFPAVFFPGETARTGLIYAFSTYAIGFAARPLGGLVFGHFGDKFGRKKLLQLSILMVGVATFLMGCLPSYAQIGFLAPLLLVVLPAVRRPAGQLHRHRRPAEPVRPARRRPVPVVGLAGRLLAVRGDRVR